MSKVDNILTSIDSLPPFPEVAQRAMQVLNDPDSSTRNLVQIIEYDPGITATILRICNSAYFGLPTKISSLHQAVSYMGQKHLLTVLMAGSLLRYHQGRTPGYDLEQGELWRHSVSCSIASQILARKTGQHQIHELFTAGLLHDIGKLVISIFVEQEFKEIVALARDSGISFLEAERQVLGMDHAEVGGRIVRIWNFPESICRCVEMHHRPNEAPEDDTLTPIIYLADICSIALGIGVGEDGLMYRYYPQVVERFGLSQKDTDHVIAELDEEMGKAEELFKIE